MLDTLRDLIAQDSDYSQRMWGLEIRRRVLCGTIYDLPAISLPQRARRRRIAYQAAGPAPERSLWAR